MSKTSDDIQTLWELTSQYLMCMNEQEKFIAIKQTDTEELKRIFSAALRREDYEICGAIKTALEARGGLSKV